MPDDDPISPKLGSDARGFTREERKEIVKEALTEWLDRKTDRAAMSLGRWFFRVAVALIVAAIAYAVLWAHGWRLT